MMKNEDNDLTIAYMAGYHKAKGECKDDFESRTCENCKYYIKEQKLYDIVAYICRHEEVGDCVYDDMGKDFGCNKFSRKDE